MAHVGQRIVYRLAESDYRSARITKIVDGTTVNLVAFATGDEWWPGVPGDVPAMYIGEVAQGTAVGTWQEASGVDPAVEAAIGDRCAVPAAGTHPTLALNTPRQPNASRPTCVTVYGTWAWSLSAIGSQAGTATLQSDGSSTPTTVQGIASCARGVSVGITVGDTGTMPWVLTYEVPAGHYYQIATSGSGTFAITHITEQAR